MCLLPVLGNTGSVKQWFERLGARVVSEVLLISMMAKAQGKAAIIVPSDNVPEAAVVQGVDAYPV